MSPPRERSWPKRADSVANPSLSNIDVNDTLGPDIIAALDALTAREADFDALGLNSLVVSDLETLQNDTDALGAALVTLSSTDVQAEAEAVITEVDAAFASAIAVFS